MNCKNCNAALAENTSFCSSCGAKVITSRITTKKLLSELFTNLFGIDNKFIRTLWDMLIRPGVLLSAYLKGTRKRYVRPFAFFAITTAITVFSLSMFSEEYLSGVDKANSNFESYMQKMFPKTHIKENLDKGRTKLLNEKEQQKADKRAAFQRKTQETILKYMNLISFLLLPLYAFIAYLVFGRPYNFGEHLVINAYIQGVLMLLMTISFFVSLALHFDAYSYAMLFNFVYYPYVYQRLYHLSFKRLLLKTLKFIPILLGAIILFGILMIALGFIIALIQRA